MLEKLWISKYKVGQDTDTSAAIVKVHSDHLG